MPLPGDGLIFEDPNFIAIENFDFNYLEISPCIDMGDPEELDPDNTRIDIGANYFDQIFLPTGDCNEDEFLNVLDLIMIVNECILCVGYDECPECFCADMNLDEQVNILDIVFILNLILYED